MNVYIDHDADDANDHHVHDHNVQYLRSFFHRPEIAITATEANAAASATAPSFASAA